jgi:hypothetical protein
VASPTRRPPFTPPRKILGTHFCLRLSQPQGHSAAGRIRSIEKSNDPIENLTRDLLVCSIVPHHLRFRLKAVRTLVISFPLLTTEKKRESISQRITSSQTYFYKNCELALYENIQNQIYVFPPKNLLFLTTASSNSASLCVRSTLRQAVHMLHCCTQYQPV